MNKASILTRDLQLGALMRRSRERHGLSLQDVANKAGITKAHVWDLETGRSQNPTVKTLAALAVALSVPFPRLCNAAWEDLDHA